MLVLLGILLCVLAVGVVFLMSGQDRIEIPSQVDDED